MSYDEKDYGRRGLASREAGSGGLGLGCLRFCIFLALLEDLAFRGADLCEERLEHGENGLGVLDEEGVHGADDVSTCEGALGGGLVDADDELHAALVDVQRG